MPMPEAALEDARAVILAAPPPEPAGRSAGPSPDLLEQLLRGEVGGAGDPPRSGREPPISAEELAERRERVDRMLRAVLAEPDAGFRAHRRALSGVRGPLPHRGPRLGRCPTSPNSAAC